MDPTYLAAVDVGAESGRVVLGTWDGLRMTETVVHRFPNGARATANGLRWDHRALAAGMIAGLTLAVGAARSAGGRLAAIGIDTWGVDYVLLDDEDEPLEAPWHYRDGRTAGVRERLAATVSEDDQWRRTGTAPLPFNTIYQLAASDPALLRQARRLVTMPDWLRGLLCGTYACEWTNAGTTGLTVAGRCAWDQDLIAHLGLPAHLFTDPVAPGTVLGPVRPAMAGALGCSEDPPLVIATPGHDTAAAVAAVPGDDAGAAFLSCGTWSLLGRLEAAPRLDDDVRRAGFSNEIAHDGRVRLLRNIMGLWVLQECRRGFAEAGRTWTYGDLTAAAEAEAPGTPVDIDDPRFFPPGTAADPMPARVRAWCRERGLPEPTTDAAVARRVIEGLAASYRNALKDLARLTGRPVTHLHLLGGGSRNGLLCRLTAEAAGIPVLAGPAEATALGTLLCAATAVGCFPASRLPWAASASAAPRAYQPEAAAATG